MALFPESPRKRHWCISILAAAIIVIIIAIVVPLAIILPNRGNHGQKSTVLLPLYIYPESNTTWTPLYDALEAHPQLNFTIIINPSSGPGLSPYPNEQYTTSLEKLNTYPNVQTVGYIRTGYASRNISTVIAEVSTYANWASNSSTLALHGIFFDEAPHVYTNDADAYMRSINQAVKNATGLQGDKTIIHNPGTIPDPRYLDPATETDVTVIFEDTYLAYTTTIPSLAALPSHRAQYSYMIHSVPSSTDMGKFVAGISQRAAFLFVTDNSGGDFYASFGSGWAGFTGVVPS